MRGLINLFSGCIVLLFLLSGGACKNSNTENSSTTETQTETAADPTVDEAIKNIEVKTFAIDNGWGYDIYVNNEKYIHQEHIPAINGLHVFKTKEDAIKVGNLMADKIRNKIIPPTITIDELNALGIVIE
ncbi:MAG: DUF4907 domain-containing protein [Chitinophagales bacterium]